MFGLKEFLPHWKRKGESKVKDSWSPEPKPTVTEKKTAPVFIGLVTRKGSQFCWCLVLCGPLLPLAVSSRGYPVRAWSKPGSPPAETCLGRGCLWELSTASQRPQALTLDKCEEGMALACKQGSMKRFSIKGENKCIYFNLHPGVRRTPHFLLWSPYFCPLSLTPTHHPQFPHCDFTICMWKLWFQQNFQK